MKRIYFLLPNIEAARSVVDGLLLSRRVAHDDIHLLAKEGVKIEDLPEASIAQKSDLIPAIQRGAAFGGGAGLLAGLVAVAFPPAGVVAAGGAVLLATTLAGTGIGAWAAGLIGVSAPNSELKEFEQAVSQGQVLMLVDIPADEVEEVESLVLKHHPQTKIYHSEGSNLLGKAEMQRSSSRPGSQV